MQSNPIQTSVSPKKGSNQSGVEILCFSVPVASLWRRHTKLYGVRCSKSSAGWSYLCWKVSKTSYSNTFHWMKGWVLIILFTTLLNCILLDMDVVVDIQNYDQLQKACQIREEIISWHIFGPITWYVWSTIEYLAGLATYKWLEVIADCGWWCRLDQDLLLCIKQATTADGSNELQVHMRQVQLANPAWLWNFLRYESKRDWGRSRCSPAVAQRACCPKHMYPNRHKTAQSFCSQGVRQVQR